MSFLYGEEKIILEIDSSLNKFDNVVFNIESSLIKEIDGTKIQDAWVAESDERTCSACDFKTFCKNCKYNWSLIR